ncbi:SulP family inorganic anion transporter [Flammeovirga sp. EKP202]|uniref:SulP family inorganic anion transporter n=1 Tax=Flammeovirga sp. EKP202 TaxID=2770592 RepID=UPI00165FF8AC|nr:SulP family inorganic anion transporter [Flammeovirga sp. EKP202]MBD0405107.1 SulP family inorganic anion transporter [Flammeovirga sp. EKP202]
MTKNPLSIFSLIKTYKKEYISGDLSAGFATGVLLIPQGMAYAVIAGLPVQYGLYASLIAPLLYFLFGTSKKLIIGPAALDSMLLASGMLGLGILTTSPDYVNTILVVVFLSGLFQIVAGYLRLGFIANFFSAPLLKGFTTAAALLIAFSQLKNIFRITPKSSQYLHEEILSYFSQVSAVHWVSAAIGIGTILMILILKKTKFRKLGTPIVVILGIVMSIFFDFESEGIEVVGNIPSGLPTFILPDFTAVDYSDVIPLALVVAIIGFTVSNSIIKSIDDPKQPIDPNREFVALGLANSLGALFGGYQASSSFSRTAINASSGANTRASNLVSTVMIALVLLFFTDLFYYLPKPILGAIIIAATPSLLSFSYFKKYFFLKKREFCVMLITFLTTMEMGVIVGLLTGVSVSMAVFMYHTLYPHIAILGKIEGTKIHRNILRFATAKEREGTMIVRVDAPLYFSNIKYVLETINRWASERDDLHSVVIKAESINYIDVTALNELELQIDKFNDRGIKVYFATVVGPVRDLLFKMNIVQKLGGRQLFVNLYDVMKFLDDEENFSYKNKKIANQSV